MKELSWDEVEYKARAAFKSPSALAAQRLGIRKVSDSCGGSVSCRSRRTASRIHSKNQAELFEQMKRANTVRNSKKRNSKSSRNTLNESASRSYTQIRDDMSQRSESRASQRCETTIALKPQECLQISTTYSQESGRLTPLLRKPQLVKPVSAKKSYAQAGDHMSQRSENRSRASPRCETPTAFKPQEYLPITGTYSQESGRLTPIHQRPQRASSVSTRRNYAQAGEGTPRPSEVQLPSHVPMGYEKSAVLNPQEYLPITATYSQESGRLTPIHQRPRRANSVSARRNYQAGDGTPRPSEVQLPSHAPQGYNKSEALNPQDYLPVTKAFSQESGRLSPLYQKSRAAESGSHQENVTGSHMVQESGRRGGSLSKQPKYSKGMLNPSVPKGSQDKRHVAFDNTQQKEYFEPAASKQRPIKRPVFVEKRHESFYENGGFDDWILGCLMCIEQQESFDMIPVQQEAEVIQQKEAKKKKKNSRVKQRHQDPQSVRERSKEPRDVKRTPIKEIESADSLDTTTNEEKAEETVDSTSYTTETHDVREPNQDKDTSFSDNEDDAEEEDQDTKDTPIKEIESVDSADTTVNEGKAEETWDSTQFTSGTPVCQETREHKDTSFSDDDEDDEHGHGNMKLLATVRVMQYGLKGMLKQADAIIRPKKSGVLPKKKSSQTRDGPNVDLNGKADVSDIPVDDKNSASLVDGTPESQREDGSDIDSSVKVEEAILVEQDGTSNAGIQTSPVTYPDAALPDNVLAEDSKNEKDGCSDGLSEKVAPVYSEDKKPPQMEKEEALTRHKDVPSEAPPSSTKKEGAARSEAPVKQDQGDALDKKVEKETLAQNEEEKSTGIQGTTVLELAENEPKEDGSLAAKEDIRAQGEVPLLPEGGDTSSDQILGHATQAQSDEERFVERKGEVAFERSDNTPTRAQSSRDDTQNEEDGHVDATLQLDKPARLENAKPAEIKESKVIKELEEESIAAQTDQNGKKCALHSDGLDAVPLQKEDGSTSTQEAGAQSENENCIKINEAETSGRPEKATSIPTLGTTRKDDEDSLEGEAIQVSGTLAENTPAQLVDEKSCETEELTAVDEEEKVSTATEDGPTRKDDSPPSKAEAATIQAKEDTSLEAAFSQEKLVQSDNGKSTEMKETGKKLLEAEPEEVVPGEVQEEKMVASEGAPLAQSKDGETTTAVAVEAIPGESLGGKPSKSEDVTSEQSMKDDKTLRQNKSTIPCTNEASAEDGDALVWSPTVETGPDAFDRLSASSFPSEVQKIKGSASLKEDSGLAKSSAEDKAEARSAEDKKDLSEVDEEEHAESEKAAPMNLTFERPDESILYALSFTKDYSALAWSASIDSKPDAFDRLSAPSFTGTSEQ